MKIIDSDGGRLSAGYQAEKYDCVVRALAVAAEISYSQAHDLCKWAGRKDGQKTGCARDVVAAAGSEYVAERVSVARFVAAHPVGRFFVRKRGHAFALVDGVIVDTLTENSRGITLRIQPVSGRAIVTNWAAFGVK